MKRSLFEYTLQDSHIAHEPVEPRDHAKLMTVSRDTGDITHKRFSDLPTLLTANDVLVFNQTKVFPARLLGTKETGGAVEVLLLKAIQGSVWEVLGKHIPKEGYTIQFDGMFATVLEKSPERTVIEFSVSPLTLRDNLTQSGHTPLPPYIHANASEAVIRDQYQTIFAKDEGSVAAPTAGLHFTEKLLTDLSHKGIQIEYVTLHVGAGTFLPIKEDDITAHPMHSEYWSIEPSTLVRLNEARAAGKRIISVGTTTTRVLETIANNDGLLNSQTLSGETNIFIYPPYRFKFVDALITNFHLPHSTLLALVSAFASSPNTTTEFSNFPNSTVGQAYEIAKKQSYRFYSFGDGMLIF